MSIYNYEEAFGVKDKTTAAMKKALQQWYALYYRSQPENGEDPCQRVAYTTVNKLVKTIFGEYKATATESFTQQILQALQDVGKEAMQQMLVGGECYLKPCISGNGFYFGVIPRNNVLIFGRNAKAEPVDMGTVEKTVSDKFFYTLLERRRVDANGFLTIENKLYRSRNAENLGVRVSLKEHPAYAELADSYCYQSPVGSVGLIQLKTPILNCVDESADGVSVYAAAVGLIHSIDRNEAQLAGEFERGESRIMVSADLLQDRSLTDTLFVAMDEAPETVGITVFSPQLREQSFIARKQEYLRNVESVVGLKRGMLSDSNEQERTATEIASSAGDYNLTVIDFQQVWEKAVLETLRICSLLAKLYRMGAGSSEIPGFDWGNGVLYDEDQTWAAYEGMVRSGLLRPEIALGWRFNMPTQTPEDLALIRQRYMPETKE